MALLNYTTRVPVDQSVAEIQRMLVNHGAKAIRFDYDDQGRISALLFLIQMPAGDVPFKLPSNWEPVLNVLTMQKKNPRNKQRSKIQLTDDHAQRVAWRILKDWVEAQLALVSLQMVKIEQVMLLYASTADGRTVYDLFESGKMNAMIGLPSGKDA